VRKPDLAARVEQACLSLVNDGRPVTFSEVAERAQVGIATLYRRQELRAVIEDHRARGRDALTLTGLAVQLDQLRRGVDAIAEKVRRHEESIRRFERRTPNPGR
jgi:hypothetical protein